MVYQLKLVCTEDVFLERLPEIAKNAIADACTGSNPRIPTQGRNGKTY